MMFLTLVVFCFCFINHSIAQDDPACRTDKTCDCCKSNPDNGTRNLFDICYNRNNPWRCKYGCLDGYWGYKCWNRCSKSCSKCSQYFGYPDTPYGDQICFLCSDGYYNGTGITNCSTPCPANCVENQCDKTTGKCLQGCINNWRGDKCNVCADTWYGNNCNIRCPDVCKDRKCDSNGECTTGCGDDNFTGSKCDQCVVGKYGGYCDTNCSVHCKDETCDKLDGQCTDGCTGKFVGKKCDICQPDYYGTNCDNQCFYCLDGKCDRSTGRCLDCVNGKFGELCDKSCPTGCNNSICDRSTATCMHGCLLGLSGDKCCVFSQGCDICQTDTGNCESCKEGKFYGDKCDSQCPSSCFSEICSKEDGTCILCKAGYYGHTCNMTCPNKCLNNVCGQYDGICHNCSVGYYRRSCDYKCPSVCIDDACNQESGDCTYGCKNGCQKENNGKNEPQTSCYTEEIIGGIIAAVVILFTLNNVIWFMWTRRKTMEIKKNPSMHVNAIYENDKADHDGYEELQIPNQ